MGRVFAISGKFQKDNRWSERKADFKGYFMMKEENNEFEGYVIALYETSYNPKKYIEGFYDEKAKTLVFFQLSTEHFLKPAAYVFPKLNKDGFYSDYDAFAGFFYEAKKQRAQISVEEITISCDSIAEIIKNEANKIITNAGSLNMSMLKNVQKLKDYVDIKSEYYLEVK